MPLQPGARLGPYEILSPLGAGGMGEVYSARDTRLERTVAIKVLPSHLASDPALRDRFEREARAVSSLNHPHICALYDIGQHDGVDFLVMEHIEGETLAARLTNGPLGAGQAMRFAVEIADALDKAHRHGVIHRDLKPGNIMLTKAGAKLLDFGLAKLRHNEPAGAVPGSSTLLTQRADLTAEGAIVGTLQYMAPEQLEGKEADARSDIFSFGSVLYEMVTGLKAFAGKSQASVIAAILTSEPQPVSAVQPLTPPALDRVVRRCLAKDPDERWQNASDLAAELKWVAEGGSQAGIPAPVSARRRGGERMAWAAAAIFLAAALAQPFFRTAPLTPRAVRGSMAAPDGAKFEFSELQSGSLTISPDGRYVTFAASDKDGKLALWLRPLDGFSAKPLAGTEEAAYPFWSPDSRYIAFFSHGMLKKIPAAGGPAINICEAREPRGGSWSRQDVILFEPYWRDPIYRVSANGGTPEPITRLDASKSETTHRWPWFLPDGRHFLYLAGSHSAAEESPVNTVYVASLDSAERKPLVSARSNAIYAGGYLLYLKENFLVAQPFDTDRLELHSDAVTLAENVEYITGYFRAVFSASDEGTLVFAPTGQKNSLSITWRDRTGKVLGTVGEPSSYYTGLRLSPDGTHLAFGIGDPSDIWIHDLLRGVRTRLTTHPMDESGPVWSPDGRYVYYASDRNVAADIYRISADGTGSEEPILQTDDVEEPTDISNDGKLLVYNHSDPRHARGHDIFVLPLTGERKPYPFLQTEFDESDADISPDGRWISYVSDESGRRECYVRPFPSGDGRWQISASGSIGCWWRGNGEEIFSVGPDHWITAVEVSARPTFHAGSPKQLFKAGAVEQVDATADGSRLLVDEWDTTAARPPVSFVLNWPSELKR